MIKNSKCPRYSLETFIKKANDVHNKKYNYSLTEYKGNKSKIKIICDIHGIFEQTAGHHLSGSGCKLCYYNKPIYNKGSIKKFIEQSQLIHADKYNYELVEYKTAHIPVKIICPNHGIFHQRPNNHLSGRGCVKCTIKFSRQEKEVLDYIKSIYSGIIIENDRTQIKPYELDIYLPSINVGIEYNGEYWHKLKEQLNPGYHKLKAKLCKNKGIKLINISEHQWTKALNRSKNKINKTLFNKK